MTAETDLLFVAPFILAALGTTVFLAAHLGELMRRQRAYAPVRVQRRRDLRR